MYKRDARIEKSTAAATSNDSVHLTTNPTSVVDNKVTIHVKNILPDGMGLSGEDGLLINEYLLKYVDDQSLDGIIIDFSGMDMTTQAFIRSVFSGIEKQAMINRIKFKHISTWIKESIDICLNFRKNK